MNIFSRSTLFISARSPFARRVRLVFKEHDVNFTEKILDVFHPQPELTRLNPLGRVPTLRLADGQILIDSHQILGAFYQENPGSPFLPRSTSEKYLCWYWSGLGIGLAEKVIEYYLEKIRPVDKQDMSTIQEYRDASFRVLQNFETFIQNRDFVCGRRLTQADFDFGTALDYMTVRDSSDWQRKFPNTFRYSKFLGERPSFKATVPPP